MHTESTSVDLLRRAASTWPDCIGISETRHGHAKDVSWEDLLRSVKNLGASLMDRQISAGDRVGIWAPNCYEWVVSALAIQYIGAVIVPVNTRYTAHESRDILGRSQVSAVIAPGEFLGRNLLGELFDEPEASRHSMKGNPLFIQFCWADEHVNDWALSWSELLGDEEASTLAAVDDRANEVKPHDISDILFTSGTTGRSKGVLARHSHTVSVGRTWGTIAELTKSDKHLIVSPFFHTFGYKAGIISCLFHGTTIVPMAVFDVSEYILLIERYSISVISGAPTIFQSMLDSSLVHQTDLTSLRVAVTGATTVPIRLIERIQTELTCRSVITAYGLTETSGYVSSTRIGDSAEVISSTCGRVVPGMESKLAPNGELLVRGAFVMAEYLDDTESTKLAFDEWGWLRTGDVATIDENGNIRITDRLKNMYISGGFNVYPAEIEQVISQVHNVSECAVISIPDDHLGEVGCAYVVASKDDYHLIDSIFHQCSKTLAKFKIPKSIFLVDQLPRNASGKVDRNKLKNIPVE